MGKNCYVDMQCQMYYLLEELLYDINTVLDHQQRNTVQVRDIAHVISRRGVKVLGGNEPGDVVKPAGERRYTHQPKKLKDDPVKKALPAEDSGKSGAGFAGGGGAMP